MNEDPNMLLCSTILFVVNDHCVLRAFVESEPSMPHSTVIEMKGDRSRKFPQRVA